MLSRSSSAISATGSQTPPCARARARPRKRSTSAKVRAASIARLPVCVDKSFALQSTLPRTPAQDLRDSVDMERGRHGGSGLVVEGCYADKPRRGRRRTLVSTLRWLSRIVQHTGLNNSGQPPKGGNKG